MSISIIVDVDREVLLVDFPKVGKWWTLSHNSDSVKKVLQDAIEFCSTNGATKGQISGMRSKLTKNKYYVK